LEARERKRSTLEKIWARIRRRSEATGVSVQFDLTSQTPDDAQYLILDATGQMPGPYDLTLYIQDRSTGERVQTEGVLVLE
jgi:hypothetical protein